ncbi:MAG: hypothetical protein WC238_01665 [Parcubacteria group bacterium]|jgi:hypothetical protein
MEEKKTVLTHAQYEERELQKMVDDANSYWGQRFESLKLAGLKGYEVVFCLEKVERMLIHINASDEIVRYFQYHDKHPSKMEHLSKGLCSQTLPKLRDGKLVRSNLDDKHVVVKGNHGIAYASHILSAFCEKMEHRIQRKNASRQLIEDERRRQVLINREYVEKFAGELLQKFDFVPDELYSFKSRKDKQYYCVIKKRNYHANCVMQLGETMNLVAVIRKFKPRPKGKWFEMKNNGKGFDVDINPGCLRMPFQIPSFKTPEELRAGLNEVLDQAAIVFTACVKR